MATPRPDDLEDAVRDKVRGNAASILRSGRPLEVDHLHRILTEAATFAPLADEGWDEDDHRWMVEDLVESDLDDFHGTADGLIAYVPSLVDGIVLTHVLSPDERRRSMIDLGVDLAVLGRYRFRYTLASGGEVRIVRNYGSPEVRQAVEAIGLATHEAADRDGSMVGPDGWLDHFDADDLIAVRVRGRTLELTRADANPPVAPLDALLVAALEIAARRRIEDPIRDEDSGFVLADRPEHLVLDALAHEPVLLRTPGRPLSVVLEQLGLSWDRDVLLWRPAPA